MEVYTRARAWFVTYAFVSLRKPDWCDLQTAIFAPDKIMVFVQSTSGGMAPPLTHYVCAWAATVDHCSEQARVTGQPLVSVVKNTGAWEHRCVWTAHVGNQESQADLPKDVADDVEDARREAKNLQSMVGAQRQREANTGSATSRVGAKGWDIKGKGKSSGNIKSKGEDKDPGAHRSKRRIIN